MVGRAGDSERQGFSFLIVLLGDKDLLCRLARLAERARCDRTWEVRPVLPPPVHVGQAGQTGQVRPDLGGAASPTPPGIPKGQGPLAQRVLS
jgi:hypothetical protein